MPRKRTPVDLDQQILMTEPLFALRLAIARMVGDVGRIEQVLGASQERNPLRPGDLVSYMPRLMGEPAKVLYQVPDSQGPHYEIEWPDGTRDTASRQLLATEFSFGPPEGH